LFTENAKCYNGTDYISFRMFKTVFVLFCISWELDP